MDIVKPVYKDDSKEYKEGLKQKKINKISILEDFIESKEFKEYSVLLTNAIESVTRNILNDMSKEQLEPTHSLKELNIMLRKYLVQMRDTPLNTLKLLSSNIDKLGSTQ